MPLESFLNASRSISRSLSRRGMLHAGLLPLLGQRRAVGKRVTARGEPGAVALPLEGAETDPYGLAISRDGSTAYVAFRMSDPVLVVDLKAGIVRSAIDLSVSGVMLMSTQTVLSCDDKLLFVANQGVDKVAVIDTAQQKVLRVLPLSIAYGDCIKASPKGKVYIGLMDGRLAAVSCDDLTFTTMAVKGVTFDSIALSAERANILYSVDTQNRENLFHSVNLDTGVEERRAGLPAAACRPFGGVGRLLLAPGGEFAYLGWIDANNYGGFGNLTAFDLRAFRVATSTEIQDGVVNLDVHPETGKVYAVGCWGGPMEGRVHGMMYISEWDPVARKVIRRIPITLSNNIASIRLDPANPRFAYSTESSYNYLRKVDLVTGAEVMRVRFFPGSRMPTAGTAAGAVGYIGCLQAPLIHKLDLNSGKLVGALNLPAGWSGTSECAYYDGKLYLWVGGPITVINAVDGSLILSRDVPGGFLVSRLTFFQGKIAAAANPPGGDIDRILIFDARTLDVLNTIKLEYPLYGRVGCAVASPDGSKLYVQQGISLRKAVLQVLDSFTLRLRKRIEPPTNSSQGGDGDFGDFDEVRRIAYLGGFNSIYKVHMDTDEFLGMLNIYDVYKEMGRPNGWATSAIRGVHLSAAKDRLLITSTDGHSVFQYDLRKEKWVPRVTRVGLSPAATVISPERKYLYTVNSVSDNIARVDVDSGELLGVIPLGGPASLINPSSIRHGASHRVERTIPGAVMTIVETAATGGLPVEIGPPLLTTLRLDPSGRVATELDGTRVYFDGVPAPILYAYASQVGVVVPYSVAGKSKVRVQLVYRGQESFPLEFTAIDALPGIFTADSSGQGQAAMLNQDGTLNGPANPAPKGSVVVFYATGGGQTHPPGVDGEITQDVLKYPLQPVTVWVQGREAQVLYAGSAPGMVSGVMQVNIRLPMDIPSDNRVTVTMKVGNWPPSQDGVTMAVR